MPPAGATCAACAWFDGGCIARTHYGEPPLPLPAATPACERFEQLPSCDPCGACCREAFDEVPAEGGRLPPDLLAGPAEARVVRRVPVQSGGTQCAALIGGEGSPWRCTCYATRPTTCRDLARGSENCLFARRRVGLSPPAPPG